MIFAQIDRRKKRLQYLSETTPLHEFVRLIIERVAINADRNHVEATITWHTGAQQPLWIERALIRRSGKVPWTEADNTWLQAHYATAVREALQARFPHRTYTAIRKQAVALGLTRRHKGVPKPKGERWDEDENARLLAYAAGQLSYTELQAQPPGRTWGGIEHPARMLRLRFQEKPVYYHLVPDVREMVSEEHCSRMASQAYNFAYVSDLTALAAIAAQIEIVTGSLETR